MSDQQPTSVEVVVTGQVQGVFYRDSLRTEADRLGVTGWVRNEDDGSVQAHLEGPAAAVEELVDWCRTGPPRAVVEDVRSTPADPAGESDFRVV